MSVIDELETKRELLASRHVRAVTERRFLLTAERPHTPSLITADAAVKAVEAELAELERKLAVVRRSMNVR